MRSFIDIHLSCNRLIIRPPTNDCITCTKKKHIFEPKDETDEPSKVKATRKKKILVKQIGKKSLKVSIPISGFIGKFFPDTQALLMNTNIVILVLHFFQISFKF